jgi:hypothetical protein
MSALCRRSLITSAAALAVPAVAVAASGSDVVLRDLWSDYLECAAACDAAEDSYALARDAYETKLPPCPDDVHPIDHRRAHKWLWNKHGLEVLNHAANAHERMHGVVEKILNAEATGLFGIGVKLAALPPTVFLDGSGDLDPEDYIEAIASVLNDINRLIGTDFVGMEYEEAVQS